MTSRTGLSRRIQVAFALIGAMSTAPMAIAQQGTITACVSKAGSPRFVASVEDCKNNETAVTWNIVGPQGPAGPPGDPGAQGPTGPQGPQGSTGPQGPQGVTGAQGPQGMQGSKGDTGAQGPKGDAGPQGPKGDTGPQGPKGDTGPQGPQGNVGPQGAQGAVGPSGPSGAGIAANFNCPAGSWVSGFDAAGAPMCVSASPPIIASGTVTLFATPTSPVFLDLDTGAVSVTNDGTADICNSVAVCGGFATMAGVADQFIVPANAEPDRQFCQAALPSLNNGPRIISPGVPGGTYWCIRTNGGHVASIILSNEGNGTLPVQIKYVTWQ